MGEGASFGVNSGGDDVGSQLPRDLSWKFTASWHAPDEEVLHRWAVQVLQAGCLHLRNLATGRGFCQCAGGGDLAVEAFWSAPWRMRQVVYARA